MVPLLLDLAVCGVVAYLVTTRASRGAGRATIGAAGCVVALATPVVAVVLTTPQWVRPAAVMMMVAGFYALADVAGQSCGHVGDLPWDWDQFERQFSAYVASGAERGAKPRPEERAG